ncbi:MAG: endonuclease/exonuclease/phosphatase family protein [Anaerolineales bacterium]
MLYLSTIFGFWGRKWWVFELFSHFRVQYFYALFAFAVLFILTNDPLLAAITSFFLLLNLVVILPLHLHASPSRDKSGTIRIILANVQTSNSKYDKVQSLIRDVDPDIVALIEVNQTWLEELNLNRSGYPFSRVEPREDNYGIALFSRCPLVKAETTSFGPYRVPSLVAEISVGEDPLTLIVTHSPPPKSAAGFLYRNQHLSSLADYVDSLQNAAMVVGDLNITSWSQFFKAFLQDSGLRDSRPGFGVQPTWPADFPVLLIPIDHALVSSHIVVHHRAVGPKVGSDHYPVILNFSIGNLEEKQC